MDFMSLHCRVEGSFSPLERGPSRVSAQAGLAELGGSEGGGQDGSRGRVSVPEAATVVSVLAAPSQGENPDWGRIWAWREENVLLVVIFDR